MLGFGIGNSVVFTTDRFLEHLLMESLTGLPVLLLFLIMAYLPGFVLPRPQQKQSLQAGRSLLALSMTLLLAMYGGHITVGSGYGGFIWMLLCAWLLPPLAAGLAGQRPFLYGGIASFFYVLATVCFAILRSDPEAPAQSATQVRSLLLAAAGIWLVGFVACLPLFMVWRRRGTG